MGLRSNYWKRIERRRRKGDFRAKSGKRVDIAARVIYYYRLQLLHIFSFDDYVSRLQAMEWR